MRENGRERPEGPIPPFDLGTGGPQGGDSRRRRSVDGGGHGGAVVGVDGGRGWGQEGEGIMGVRFPLTSGRGGAGRSGRGGERWPALAAMAAALRGWRGVGGRWWSLWGEELRGDPFYRASEVVEGGVRRWRPANGAERLNGVATR